MKRTFVSVMLCLLCSIAWGQKMKYNGFPSLVWPKLYNIDFVKGKDAAGEYDKPVFTDAVRALDNKIIVLPGFLVPLENETSSSRVMLSSLPLNACFFCGVGGPETVIEVHLKTKTRYIEQPIEVKGILRLNDSDPDKMIYVLEQAEILRTIDL
jgi:hypothetical protein